MTEHTDALPTPRPSRAPTSPATTLSPADPTPGMSRQVALHTESMWSGTVDTEAGAVSGWHHHGDHDTTLYVVSGRMRLESGPGGEVVVEAGPGDFLPRAGRRRAPRVQPRRRHVPRRHRPLRLGHAHGQRRRAGAVRSLRRRLSDKPDSRCARPSPSSGGADPAVAWTRYENLDLWSTWSPQISGGHRRDAVASRPASTGSSSGRSGSGCRSRCWPSTQRPWSGAGTCASVPSHATLDHVVRPAPGGCTTELVIDAPAFAVIGYRPVAALALRRLVRSEL